MATDTNKASSAISDFINFLTQCGKDFVYYSNEVVTQDKLTQDYLHQIELDGLNCSERSKIATKLMANRKKRRESKDMTEILEPIIKFCAEENTKRTLNKLNELLGQVRKVEKYHDNRTYIPRVDKK